MAAPAGPVLDTAHYYMKHSFDVQDYKLLLDLYTCYAPSYPDSFSAKEVITFRVDSALTFIRLNALNTSLIVDSVGLSGNGFTHMNDTLTVLLDRTYQPGEVAGVRICYRHKNIFDHGFYSYGGFVFTDAPPEGARKWFPCWDRPSDKATTDITVKVPLSVRLGSNGILADSVISGDTLWYHWVSRDPMATYLVTLTSKVGYNIHPQWYHLYHHPSDSIPVRFFYKTGENIGNISGVITPLTDLYSGYFGDYPFEKIGFAVPDGSFPWGGMENQTMVNLYPGGFGNTAVIAHEHSHQWFGDMITCGTWADIWLNEGFATFCELLWVENSDGYSVYKSTLSTYASDFMATTASFPIYNPSWAIHTPPISQLYSTTIIYHKSACVLHQLRHVLGDSLFFAAMKSYASDTAFRFGNAVTEDFIAKVNETAGQDLSWFFNEWIYQPHYPVYENVYDIIDDGNGTWEVNLKISQTQINTVFFTMPIEIRVTFQDLSDTLIKIVNYSNNQLFNFTFSKKPTGLLFDPDNNILLKKATTLLGVQKKSEGERPALYQNEPNPFSVATMIRYHVSMPCHVRISILDEQGRLILVPVDRNLTNGTYRLDLSAGDLHEGVYYYRMEAGDYNATRKMVVSK